MWYKEYLAVRMTGGRGWVDSGRNTGIVVDDFEAYFKFLDIPAVFK